MIDRHRKGVKERTGKRVGATIQEICFFGDNMHIFLFFLAYVKKML